MVIVKVFGFQNDHSGKKMIKRLGYNIFMRSYVCITRCFVLGVLLATLTSCHKQTKPDLNRLYLSSKELTTQPPPVVLIHGITGSRLRHSETLEELWFGSLRELLFSNYQELALEIDESTLEPKQTQHVPFNVIGKVAGTNYYQAIIDTLINHGDYKKVDAGEKQVSIQRRLYVFTYDWRQDNVKSATQLSQFIKQIQMDHNNPMLKVDLVAHSMGGLISRYYMRYGEVDVLNDNDFPINLEGAKNVRKLILLGTPNLGSVSSVKSFITGLRVGLRKIPTEVLVTMPSIYQLFPHAINDWLIDKDGNALERDVFDMEVWERFQWSIFDPKVIERIESQFENNEDAKQHLTLLKRYFYKHIERARRFVWSLTVPIENVPYELIVMGGDCSLTPARLLVEEVKGESVLRLKPSHIKNPKPGVNYDHLMLEPGDGTVTKASLLARDTLDPNTPRHKYSFFPLAYPYFLCEDHSTLTSNISFQDNLLHILLSR
jgi:pimeloyl-ACP methyl ester carboxylesterase